MMKKLFRSRSGHVFKVRSPERDRDTDNESVTSIGAAIDAAIRKAETERAGLRQRMDDVMSRAAIVAGNSVDDYLTRADDKSKMLQDSETEMRRGQERLKVLDRNIAHFEGLNTELRKHFADLEK